MICPFVKGFLLLSRAAFTSDEGLWYTRRMVVGQGMADKK